jgi:hypothetical protein
MTDKKPSAAQLAALRNLAAGRSAGHGLVGRSAHGGLSATIVALHRRGWLDRTGNLTDAGKEAARG